MDKALVVDDEADLAAVVTSYLRQAGFAARTVGDGTAAVNTAREWEPDLIVLDLGLPELDGIEVCRQVRAFLDCYIVMLTARVDEIDLLKGLSAGADDYLTKPFSPRELVARVRALFRRPRRAPLATTGRLRLDAAQRRVELDGRELPLTRTEFGILTALAARSGEVVGREDLLREVWGAEWVGDTHAVDVHIANLRRKVGPDWVQTVRGVGFRLVEPPGDSPGWADRPPGEGSPATASGQASAQPAKRRPDAVRAPSLGGSPPSSAAADPPDAAAQEGS
jgi:DNA-binding response OmpR family regulator